MDLEPRTTMYCRNCGKAVNEKAVACPACGVPPRLERKFCWSCGEATQPNQTICTKCGVSLGGAGSGGKSKVAAGLLGIFLGAFGVHKFYLGYAREGAIMLLVSVAGLVVTAGMATSVMALVGFIEGVIYLTKSDGDFSAQYVHGKKAWF
jgi:TM2 domain-containing membrane protein YozV/RNA polymerase subunit RPABC4/transcription elongation factor Spt4